MKRRRFVEDNAHPCTSEGFWPVALPSAIINGPLSTGGIPMMADDKWKLARVGVEDLEAVLGLAFPVLDDGFVRVVDYMGSDEAIVQAARISYGVGTKQVSEDRGLIRYLMRHRHTTPFEMCEIKLHVRVPMHCWRQWIRHRTANVNEYSTRYSEAIDAAQRTRPDEWREQSAANRQGSGAFLDSTIGEGLSEAEAELHSHARQLYSKHLEVKVAREQARKNLPLSTYTEAYWKIDLHNLLHFLALRMEEHSQLEIRSYANVIGHDIVSKWCPLAWEAFLDYRLQGQAFSRLEMAILREIHNSRLDAARALAESYGWLEVGPEGLKRNRERDEFQRKLRDMGLTVPWEETNRE
jgi:thymidylate synthase (FAD)